MATVQQGMTPVSALPQDTESQIVLDVRELETQFVYGAVVARAVNKLSFQVRRGETLCIVGESGSGKSVTALSIMRLLPSPPARLAGGSIDYEGRDLLQLPEREMRSIRGNDISMIFQEPMTSLNPVLTCGFQIAEVVRRHQRLSKQASWDRAVEMLRLVRIPEPARRAAEYPHQLSGGMRQRVMIAMALSCNPKLIIADEPTTALDVTTQAQILRLIAEQQSRLKTAMVLITHDLGVVAETADRVIVMYAGSKVEEAPVADLFARPLHPYTVGLMRSVPKVGSSANEESADLAEIPGVVPPLIDLPPGCPFAPRCPLADDKCRAAKPPLEQYAPGHWSACWHAEHATEVTF
jgi:peptide/nickel transport system ATP-binding protein